MEARWISRLQSTRACLVRRSVGLSLGASESEGSWRSYKSWADSDAR